MALQSLLAAAELDHRADQLGRPGGDHVEAAALDQLKLDVALAEPLAQLIGLGQCRPHPLHGVRIAPLEPDQRPPLERLDRSLVHVPPSSRCRPSASSFAFHNRR